MQKFLFLFSGLLLLNATSVQAQEDKQPQISAVEEIDFGLEADEPKVDDKAVPSAISEEFAEEEIFESIDNSAEKIKESQKDAELAENSAEVGESSAKEDVTEDKSPEEEPLEATTENLSKLVAQLNLSDEQLDTLKFLSDESKMRQEQLLKSVEQLKAQAKEIEEQSLREFMEILTSEQKETFEKIRAMNAELSAK